MMNCKRRITKAYFELACIKYAPLIHRLSTLVGINQTHTEELKSHANEEILKCMICYDGSGSFITFLYGRLHGTFRHMRDNENRARRMITGMMGSLVNMPEDEDINMDLSIMINECLDCLRDDERDLIVDIFFNNKTMREISFDNGTPLTNLSRKKKGAMNKMKARYGVELV